MFEKGETCGICGGDGRIGNTFGASKTCPSCMGSGRRAEDLGFRNVTKTKSDQGRQPSNGRVEKPGDKAVYLTAEGAQLAREVRDCPHLADAAKAALIGEIAQYENEHGSCTSTFLKKVRKRLRPADAKAK